MWLRKKDFEILMEQIDEKLIPMKEDIEKLKHPPKFKYGDVVDVEHGRTHLYYIPDSYIGTRKKVKIIGVSWVRGSAYEPHGWAYTIDTGSGCVRDIHEVFINLSNHE